MEPLSSGKEMGPLRYLAAAKPGACNLLQELQPEALFSGGALLSFSQKREALKYILGQHDIWCVFVLIFFLFVCFHVILLSVTLNNSLSLLLLTLLKY